MDYMEWFPSASELRSQEWRFRPRYESFARQSESYINKIENKHTLPSMAGFSTSVEYFGITPDKFFNTDSASPFSPGALLLAEFWQKLRSRSRRAFAIDDEGPESKINNIYKSPLRKNIRRGDYSYCVCQPPR